MLAESVGQQRLKASALSELALNEFRLSDTESAITHCQQALPLLKRSRDAAERTKVLCTIVVAYNDMSMHAEALVHAKQAIDSARVAGDPSLMSWALNRASLTYEDLGDHDRGEPLMLQALAIAREINGSEEIFSALNNMCAILLSASKTVRGDAQRAILRRLLDFGNEALKLSEESGNGYCEAMCLGSLADALSGLGKFDDALVLIERQKELSKKNGYRGLEISAVLNRADLERRRGDLDAAIRLYKQVLAELREADDYALLPETHQALYESYKLYGDFGNALKHHEALLELEREVMKQRADRQVRLLLNRIELEHVQATAERARLDAEVQRLRAAKLESENEQLAVQAKELGRHALEDQLTGLANRRRVDRELPAQLALAKDRNSALCLAGIDLDYFKLVNDRFGHAIGDDVLRAVARILLDNTRSSDLLARMGGEEFLVLFVGTPLDVAHDICERLRQAVESHDWNSVVAGLRVTISVGLCDADGSSDVRGLLERADGSLYAAKRAGRNRVEVAMA